jgi:hypothetical protein
MGAGSLPGVKRPERDADPSPPSSAEVWKQSRAIFLLSLRVFVACEKGETYLPVYSVLGTRWRSWVRHCAASPKFLGSISDGVIENFYGHNPSGRTMVVGLTQPLTEMSTRNISWGVKAAGALGLTTSWNPMDLSRRVQGLLYIFLLSSFWWRHVSGELESRRSQTVLQSLCKLCVIGTRLNPLTPELNLSAHRCLKGFFTGDFATWTVHVVNICVKNQQMHQLFIQFINYVW